MTGEAFDTTANRRLTRSDVVADPLKAARAGGLLLFVALVCGVIVRGAPVFGTDFILNDGGLFSLMSQELVAKKLAWPAFTSYNGGGIPFAYPPFGLYLDAVIRAVVGIGPETTLRVLPLAFAILSVPAFYFMARAWTGPMSASIATFAWAVLPRAWIWLIAGGGVTRAPGLVFAFLAVGFITRLLQDQKRTYWIGGSLFSGLTLLSHLEGAGFVFVTLAIAWLVRDRSMSSLRRIALVAVAGLVIASPWWINVIVVHGPAPLLAAGQSRWFWLPFAFALLLSFRFTAEPYFAIGAIFGSAGLVISLARGKYWLPLWLVSIFLVVPGAAPTYAMAPLAMLIALAAKELGRRMSTRRRMVASFSVGVVGVLVSLWAPYLSGGLLSSVSRPQRDSMEWVKGHTPARSRFLVVTGADWPVDAIAEWFPVLAGRSSVGTVQGLEFATPDAWRAAVDASDGVETCSNGTAECLVHWADTWERSINYVFIPRGPGPGITDGDCCPLLVESLRSDYRFSLEVALAGGYVFKRTREGG